MAMATTSTTNCPQCGSPMIERYTGGGNYPTGYRCVYCDPVAATADHYADSDAGLRYEVTKLAMQSAACYAAFDAILEIVPTMRDTDKARAIMAIIDAAISVGGPQVAVPVRQDLDPDHGN